MADPIGANGYVTRNGETLLELHAQMMAALRGRQYTKALREAEEELMATTVDPGKAHTLYGTGQQYADYLASATKATAGFLANRAQGGFDAAVQDFAARREMTPEERAENAGLFTRGLASAKGTGAAVIAGLQALYQGVTGEGENAMSVSEAVRATIDAAKARYDAVRGDVLTQDHIAAMADDAISAVAAGVGVAVSGKTLDGEQLETLGDVAKEIREQVVSDYRQQLIAKGMSEEEAELAATAYRLAFDEKMRDALSMVAGGAVAREGVDFVMERLGFETHDDRVARFREDVQDYYAQYVSKEEGDGKPLTQEQADRISRRVSDLMLESGRAGEHGDNYLLPVINFNKQLRG